MTKRLALEKKYKRGKRTFLFIFIDKSWWLALISFGFFYLGWAIYWGNLKEWAIGFLVQHPDWFVTPTMLAQWSALLGISFLLVAYLQANVHYRMYKFILDKYAVHLRRGLFNIRETTIPYHQITNVHISRPYHYRIFGLAQLDIVTAADRSDDSGEKTKEFLMPTIDISLARLLSRQLLESSARSRNKAVISKDFTDDEDEDADDDENTENDDDTDEEDGNLSE